MPSAQVGYFGLERNEQTAVARRYYEKVPKDLEDAIVYLLAPMLATGGSAAMAIEAEVYTAALDRGPNDRKYIVPGLSATSATDSSGRSRFKGTSGAVEWRIG